MKQNGSFAKIVFDPWFKLVVCSAFKKI